MAALLPALRFALERDATAVYLTSKNTQQPQVARAFEDLIAAYPDEYFDDSPGGCNCVVDSAGNPVEGSMRYRPIPVFAPPSYVHQTVGPHFQVMNFAGVWISHVDAGPPGKRNVWARFMGFTGVGTSVREALVQPDEPAVVDLEAPTGTGAEDASLLEGAGR